MASSGSVFGAESRNDAFPDPIPDDQQSEYVASPQETEEGIRSKGYLSDLLNFYATLAMRHAVVEEIEPSSWFASIEALRGVFGEGGTAEEALADLKDSIPGWASLGLEVGADDIPAMDGLDLKRFYRRGHGKTAKADFQE